MNNKKMSFLLAGGGFTPITNFPAFTNYAASSSLTPFINNLYTYAIGIAVILAVIEIIWGGFLWMGSGASVSNKSTGRSKILMSILGLILVLSPYLILSVLNPSILSLKLGSNNLNINMNKVSTTTNAKTKYTCPTNQTLSLYNGCYNSFVLNALNNGGLNSNGYILACKTLASYPSTTGTSNLSEVCIYNKESISTPVSINTTIPQTQEATCTKIAGSLFSHLKNRTTKFVTKINGGCSGSDWKILSNGVFKKYTCTDIPSPPKNYICLYLK